MGKKQSASHRKVPWKGTLIEKIANPSKTSCKNCLHCDTDGFCWAEKADLNVIGYCMYKYCTKFCAKDVSIQEAVYSEFLEIHKSKPKYQEEKAKQRGGKNIVNSSGQQSSILSDNAIGIDCNVVLYDYQEKKNVNYIIVSDGKANINYNLISIKSKLGESLLGKQQGEDFTIVTLDGHERYRILSWNRLFGG